MPTRANQTFDVNIERAGYFLDIHEEASEGPGAPTLPYRELPRGSIVFAVGALDAYLSEVSAEVMVAQLQRRAAAADEKDLLRRVQQEIPTLALEMAVLGTQAERVRRLHEGIVEHFQNYVSNHGAKAVAATFQRFGARPADLWGALEADGFAEPAQQVDHWTDVRHQIVHQGRRPTVRRPQARNFIRLVSGVVERIDARAEQALGAAGGAAQQ